MSDFAGSAMRDSQEGPVRKFIAFKTLSVCDVRSKFQEKAAISTSEFSCSIDPEPTAFHLEFLFGTEEHPDKLEVRMFVLTRTIEEESFTFTIYNEEAKQVAKWADSSVPPVVRRQGQSPLILETKLKEIKDKKLESWHFTFSLVYTEHRIRRISDSAPTAVSRLQKNLGELLESGRDTDVTFLVRGEKIKAHKTLLSVRCPYFERMFQSQMNEAVTNEIHVSDVSPAVFREMLNFIYTEQGPQYSEETTLELLSTADKYGIVDLRDRCVDCLVENLGPQNVIEVLLVAEQIDDQLFDAAKSTFIQYKDILLQTPEWKELVAHPALLLSLLGLFCDII